MTQPPKAKPPTQRLHCLQISSVDFDRAFPRPRSNSRCLRRPRKMGNTLLLIFVKSSSSTRAIVVQQVLCIMCIPSLAVMTIASMALHPALHQHIMQLPQCFDMSQCCCDRRSGDKRSLAGVDQRTQDVSFRSCQTLSLQGMLITGTESHFENVYANVQDA